MRVTYALPNWSNSSEKEHSGRKRGIDVIEKRNKIEWEDR